MTETKIFADIAAERQKHMRHGFDAANDDKMQNFELAKAGLWRGVEALGLERTYRSRYEPWQRALFFSAKTVSKRQKLVQAAALLVAEIARLDRLGR